MNDFIGLEKFVESHILVVKKKLGLHELRVISSPNILGRNTEIKKRVDLVFLATLEQLNEFVRLELEETN